MPNYVNTGFLINYLKFRFLNRRKELQVFFSEPVTLSDIATFKFVPILETKTWNLCKTFPQERVNCTFISKWLKTYDTQKTTENQKLNILQLLIEVFLHNYDTTHLALSTEVKIRFFFSNQQKFKLELLPSVELKKLWCVLSTPPAPDPIGQLMYNACLHTYIRTSSHVLIQCIGTTCL